MASSTTNATLLQFARDQFFDGTSVKDERALSRALAFALKTISEDRKWSYLRTRKRLVTVAPASSTMSVNAAATAVTAQTFGTFSSGSVGRMIEFNGEQKWYEIASQSSDVAAVLVDAYQGSANLTAASSVVVAPFLALPDNFLNAIDFIGITDGNTDIEEIGLGEMERKQAVYAGSSIPTEYCFRTKRNDSTIQIALYPPPAGIYEYELWYYRRAGWLDATTRAWIDPASPTATTNIVDWPDTLRPLLEDAIRMGLAREIKSNSWAQQTALAYARELARSQERDEEGSGKIYIGRRAASGFGVLGSKYNT